MDQDTNVKSHLQALPLDSSLLVLKPDIEEFFKVEAGIQDTEELKKHIVQVQEEAYKVAHRSFPEPRSSVEAVTLRFVLRSSRTLAFGGSDSRCSRSLGCPRIRASSNF